MKLRNKKTGEIRDFIINKDKIQTSSAIDCWVYNSLAELNAEWEDYEDELLYIISAEHKSGYQCVLKEEYPEICEVAKELGIGFETEEEAEKALEKLKAWKRLKDKGFRFTEISRDWDTVYFDVDIENLADPVIKDLDICFGGEE